MIDSCRRAGRDREACELGNQDDKELQDIAIGSRWRNGNPFQELEHTSLVENRIDGGEEEFGNDFHASLEGDDGIAGDHFDCADCFRFVVDNNKECATSVSTCLRCWLLLIHRARRALFASS